MGWFNNDQDIYDKAALDQLFGKVSFDTGVFGNVSKEETDRRRRNITGQRKLADQQPDKRWRKAYHKWLDYAEYCCDKADKYRSERPDWERRNKERKELDARERDAVRELMSTNPPWDERAAIRAMGK